jgi:EAL domain-containing protein (putative c-di-GMP-specific phosphodiesterase class I)
VRVALDDFGSGFSSIGYLRQLPVDILKIDRSFVSDPGADGSGAPLLEAIVGLGQRLDLVVIPEGIEQPEQLDLLLALGCTLGQGFMLSRPITPGEIEEWLTSPLRTLAPSAVSG